METPNQTPKVDTLTLQLEKSIEFEALKKEVEQLRQENARLREALLERGVLVYNPISIPEQDKKHLDDFLLKKRRWQ